MCKFLNIKELSEKHNISKESINRYCRKDLIRFKMNGRVRLASEEDLVKLIEDGILKSKLYKMNTDIFKQRTKEKLGDNYQVLSEYKGQKEKIRMLHIDCFNTYMANPCNVIDNGNGCPYCFGTEKKDINDYKLEVLNETNGEFSVIDDAYKSNKEKVLYKHNIDTCNKEFLMRPNDFNRRKSCPICRQSKGEKRIKEFLLANNILFEAQYPFYRYTIDFCINSNNDLIFIEYDGEQHFKPYFMCNDESEFLRQVERDIDKDKLCSKSKNIKLIRISYNNLEKIEEILNDTLIERKFNDYPFGEYSKVRGNGGYPNIIYIG